MTIDASMQTILQRILVACALTLSCCCHAQPNLGSQKQNANVAIVGAGVGGAFTAFNLRQLLNDTVNIHVYVWIPSSSAQSAVARLTTS